MATAVPIRPAQITGRYHSMASALLQSAARPASCAAEIGLPAIVRLSAGTGRALRDQPVDVVDAEREHDAVGEHEQRQRHRRCLRAGTGEVASAVRRMPSTIQGWRPLSVTTQPAITATKPTHQHCAMTRKIPARLEQRAAPPQKGAEQRRGDHEEADRQHDAEGEEHDLAPAAARCAGTLVKPGNRPFIWCVRMSEEPCGIEISKRLTPAFSSGQAKISKVAGLAAVPMRFHGRDLDRLMLAAC